MRPAGSDPAESSPSSLKPTDRIFARRKGSIVPVRTADIIRIEATSGGYKIDESYRRELGIPPEAIVSGIYLRPMSRRESVGVMLGTLMEYHSQGGRQKQRFAAARLALRLNPKDVAAMPLEDE